MNASPPGAEEAADDSRLGDPQWFALAWYGETLQRLCAGDDLARLHHAAIPPRLAELPGVSSGHVVVASRDLVEPDGVLLDGFDGVVVGGPCLADCTGYPTLEALYDSVQTVLTARALGARAVLYLGDREEVLERGGGEKRWSDVARNMERWLGGVLAAIGADDVAIVRTSTEAHEEALSAGGRPSDAADGRDLDACFHLGRGPVTEQEPGSRRVTGRVVEAHLPAVVARHVGWDGDEPPRVLVAENLQQTGVFRLARKLAGADGAVSFLGFWPAPGLSATLRMYRSESWDKIRAWELPAAADGSLAGVHPHASQFYRSWLDSASRRDLAQAARGK